MQAKFGLHLWLYTLGCTANLTCASAYRRFNKAHTAVRRRLLTIVREIHTIGGTEAARGSAGPERTQDSSPTAWDASEKIGC